MSDGSLSIGVAIPAYRNAERLARALNSIRKLDPNWLSTTVVVDDSGDGCVARALESEFPNVRFIAHDQNFGFATAANRAVTASDCDLVLLLNDDAELIADPREQIQESFRDSGLFALSLTSVDEAGQLREGAKRLVWRFGVARILHNPQDQRSSQSFLQPTDYAVGGHAVFRREIFARLNGFDSLFHPFYWEDADLCARAIETGFRVAVLPVPCVRHRIGGAIASAATRDQIKAATLKNRILFSRRHARSYNAALFPLGLLWRELAAILKQDRLQRTALQAARDAIRNQSARHTPDS